MQENNEQIQDKGKKGRLFLLGASSMILSMSFIMAVFAPFPLSLASVMYGRLVGYLLGMACLGVALFISVAIFKQTTMFFFYGLAFLFSVFITEIVLRGMKPMNGLFKFGLGFVLFLATVIGISVYSSDISLKQMIVEEVQKSTAQLSEQKEQIMSQSSGEDTIRILTLLSQPELMAAEILKTLPSYFFISVFFVLWANLYLVLKSRRMLFMEKKFSESEKSLLDFKVPENTIWFLVLGLLLAVVGEEYFSIPWATDIGLTLVKCLGLFYFFQGFGLYMRFLDYIKLKGLLRTFLVLFTVLIAPWLLALIGVFDMWVDFKKYLEKKEQV